MKVKKVIYKKIDNTDLMVSNTGYLYHQYGKGEAMEIGSFLDLNKLFDESEMEMIDDTEDQEFVGYTDSISFENFMKLK